jgi:glutathione peroxidase
MTKLALLAFAAFVFAAMTQAVSAADKSIYDFKVNDIDGKPVDLSQYKGKVLMVVNTASKCGNTPQYANLEQVYKKYKAQGFEVLAFPANEFRNQEPGTNADIKEFCTSTYMTTFPLFSKIVVKGDGIHPLYQYLTKEANPAVAGDVTWNFQKYLVNRQGKVVAKFDPKTKPDTADVTAAIEKELAAK